jgi:N-acetylmuramoyl-L-alanine amidase
MIGIAALLAVAQAAAQVPARIIVREGDHTTPVAVVSTRLGPMIRLEDTLLPLGAVLLHDARDRYRLVATGSTIELTVGLSFARAQGIAQPLAAPPTVFEGRLYVPLSLLTDVLPRVADAYTYDAASTELRRSPRGNIAAAPSAAPAPARPDSPAVTPSPPPRAAAPPPREERRARRIVVVDAGHGGPDRGMRGPAGSRAGIEEADITLAVARRLRDSLQARGVDVLMTRSTDTLIALGDRGRIANRAQADVFVSVHVNAANPRWRNPSAARGFETYFLAEAKTEDERRVAMLENESSKYDAEADSRAGDPLSFVLNDMKQNEYLRESSDFARTVQRSLAAVHPGTNRGVKQAGFVVLVSAFMPAVLVEIGFGSNPSDAAWIASARGQGTLAAAIADATMSYLTSYERRGSAGPVP